MLQNDVHTSAGLHFMASVRRKAIECQDASTNTDPGKMLFFFSFKNSYILHRLLYLNFFFKIESQRILNYMI